MTALDKFVSEVTPDERAAGFFAREVRCLDSHLSGGRTTALLVVHTWGDPSHRLVKMQRRDGRAVFQLQAFGRHKCGVDSVGWFPERHWPGVYGPAWVIERLREHLARPEYQALIELLVPNGDEDRLMPPDSAMADVHAVSAGQQGSNKADDFDS